MSLRINGEVAGGASGSVTAADITDATATGRSVLTAADAAAGRTALGAETAGAAETLVGVVAGVDGALSLRSPAAVTAISATSLASVGPGGAFGTMTYAAGVLTAGEDIDLAGALGVSLGDTLLFRFTSSNRESSGVYTITDLGADDPGGHPPEFTRRSDFAASGDFTNGAGLYAGSTPYALIGIGEGFTLDTDPVEFAAVAVVPTSRTVAGESLAEDLSAATLATALGLGAVTATGADAAAARAAVGLVNRAAVPGKTPVAWWRCDETSGTTLANSGSAASADLTAAASLRVGRTTLWPDRCVDGIDNANSVATGAPAVEPATYTVMGTILLRAYPAGYGIGLYKLANLASAAAPTWSIGGWGLNNTSDGRVIAGVTIGGSNILAVSSGDDRVMLGRRHHLASTHDGTTLRLYLDGNEVASTAAVGAVDYSNHGRWSLLNFDPATSIANLAVTGQCLDARVYDSVLTGAEIRAVAAAALGA